MHIGLNRFRITWRIQAGKNVVDLGGTLRLGAWPCHIKKATKASAAYATDSIQERHRHRYEVNNEYVGTLEENGMTVSGVCPQGDLVEIFEIPTHRWSIACQFRPEFKSRPRNPHPLFRDFVGAALDFQTERNRS